MSYERPHKNFTYRQAQKFEQNRSAHSKAVDLALTAERRFNSGDKDYSEWRGDPNRYDISGIDTPGSKEFLERARRGEKVEISPSVRWQYDIWHEQYEKDRSEGKHRKPLSVLALEKYYRANKRSFEAEGGSAHAFNDQFDKIDAASATDSWGDLDSELERHNILSSVSTKELEHKAREARKQEKEIEDSYADYLRDMKKQDPTGYEKHYDSKPIAEIVRSEVR